MLVIIVGAGEVGCHLAKNLSAEHDVVIVESNPEKCAFVREHFDVLAINDSGSSVRALRQAGINRAGMLIAVSAIDEINIMACMMAAQFGVERKIARIRNPEYALEDAVLKPKQLGIDLMINPEQTTAEEILSLVSLSSATDVIEYAGGRAQLFGVRLDPKAEIINRTLEEVSQANPHLRFRTVAIYRDEKTLVPTGKEYFRKGDQIFVTSLAESVPHLLKLCGKDDGPVHKVMILGGGLVGRLTAKLLEQERNLDVKLIESSRQQSATAAAELQKTLVIRGEGSDVDLLVQEDVMSMDTFVALAEDEETNIITCLLARHLGVKRTITLVSKSDYVPLLPAIGLDVAVDKRKITANAIARFIRSGEVVSIATLRGVEAEAHEVVVQPGAKIVGRLLRKIRLPDKVVIGCAMRNGEAFIPVGDTVFQAHDQVVLFGSPKTLSKAEKLFG